MPPDPSCVRGDMLVCCDDLCHGSDTTVCGLERYLDFDTQDEFGGDDDDY